MGCLSRIFTVVALLVQMVSGALGMLVLGSAATLDEAALISASDAIILFVLLGLSLLCTLFLALKLWRGSSRRKDLERDVETLRMPHRPNTPAPHPTNVTP